MRIRNRALLDKFVKKHADSKKAIQTFIEFVEEAEWQCLNDIKADINSVDYVTNERYVLILEETNTELLQ